MSVNPEAAIWSVVGILALANVLLLRWLIMSLLDYRRRLRAIRWILEDTKGRGAESEAQTHELIGKVLFEK